MKKIITVINILLLFAVSVVNAEEIIISAGSGPLDSVVYPVKNAFEKESKIELHILFGSASLSFKQLLRGVSEAGIIGTTFEEGLKLMQKESVTIEKPEELKPVVIGKAKVRAVVNSTNKVSKLSREQLKDIFTGKITNWKDVGGDNMPIMVIVSTLNPATVGTFKKIINNNEEFAKDILHLGHFNEIRDALQVNVEAISFGTSALLGEGVKELETPDVSRAITLITRGEPKPKIQKFIDFILKGNGKKLVKE